MPVVAVGREVQRGRAAEPSRADDERARRAQSFLPLDAEFLEEDVPGVAEELLVVQAAKPGVAPCAKLSSPSPPAWSARPTASAP